MKAFKRFDLSGANQENLTPLISMLNDCLGELFRVVNRIAFGTITDRGKLENFDAVWLVVQFVAASTDLTVQHGLGRIPVGLLQLECPLGPGETLLAGQVLFKSATATTVTLQSTGANKKARVILF